MFPNFISFLDMGDKNGLLCLYFVTAFITRKRIVFVPKATYLLNVCFFYIKYHKIITNPKVSE